MEDIKVFVDGTDVTSTVTKTLSEATSLEEQRKEFGKDTTVNTFCCAGAGWFYMGFVWQDEWGHYEGDSPGNSEVKFTEQPLCQKNILTQRLF